MALALALKLSAIEDDGDGWLLRRWAEASTTTPGDRRYAECFCTLSFFLLSVLFIHFLSSLSYELIQLNSASGDEMGTDKPCEREFAESKFK